MLRHQTVKRTDASRKNKKGLPPCLRSTHLRLGVRKLRKIFRVGRGEGDAVFKTIAKEERK